MLSGSKSLFEPEELERFLHFGDLKELPWFSADNNNKDFKNQSPDNSKKRKMVQAMSQAKTDYDISS